MMLYKYCLILLAFSLSLSATAQQNDTLRRKDGDGRYFVQIRSFGLVTDEGYLQNNIPDGIWTKYWHTYFPREITTYKMGKKNGSRILVAVTGDIEAVENYKNDALDGPMRVYNGEGKILEEALYSGGKKHGPYTKWYPNGKKQEESSYVNDKRDGNGIWYHNNGEKAAEYTYRNDVIDGNAVTYFKNGKVSQHGLYKNGKQVDTWKEYYENGNLKAEGKCVDGEKEGPWKEYDAEGKLTRTVTYKNGEPK